MKKESLQQILDKRKVDFAKNAPIDIKTIYSNGIRTVADSGIYDQAISIGDIAPNFELTNASGKKVSLQDYLNLGPVVLTWYRGGWCPYCNITLLRLQSELPRFKELGANLLALTPERPDKSLSTSEKNELEFEVLSDLHNQVAKSYGIVFKLNDDVANIYQSKFDLHDFNDDESNELPLAATYVIDTDGVIRYAFLDAEYRNRSEPEDILAVLSQLNN